MAHILVLPGYAAPPVQATNPMTGIGAGIAFMGIQDPTSAYNGLIALERFN